MKLVEGNGGTRWQLSAATIKSAAGILGLDTRFDFNSDNIVNVADIAMLRNAILTSTTDMKYDIDGNLTINANDGIFYIHECLFAKFGDVNLDFHFNSTDLTLAYQSGEFQDATENNSYWEEGDWNFDGDFDTSDLVLAWGDGYEN